MTNETTSSERQFVDNLEFLFLDCWSGDPDRAIFCRINTALGAMASIVLPIFMAGGFFGNSLTAYIYLWKLRPLTRQGVYFSAIALSDNCILFMTGFLWMFLAKGLPWISGAKYGFFIVNESNGACRVMRYLESLFSLTSSILFLMMVIDRCLSVYFPFRLQQVKAKTTLLGCLIASLFCALAAIPVGVHFHWIEMGKYTVCYFLLQGWEYTTFYAYMLLLMYPPTVQFFIILIANGFLIHKMRHIVSEQAEIRAGQGDGKLTNTVICVALSAILIISSCPTVAAIVFDLILTLASIEINPSTKKLVWGLIDIGRILILFNQSVNWIVLLWKSGQFRAAFLGVGVCCDDGPSRQQAPLGSNRPAATGQKNMPTTSTAGKSDSATGAQQHDN